MMDLLTVLILLFSLAALFNLGLGMTGDDFALALRDKRALARALLANAVLTPVLLWVLLRAAGMLGETLPGQIKELVGQTANEGLSLGVGVLIDRAGGLIGLGGGQPLVILLLALASGNLLAPALAKIAGGRADYARAISATAALLTCIVLPVGLAILPLGAGAGEVVNAGPDAGAAMGIAAVNAGVNAGVDAAGASAALLVLLGTQLAPFAAGFALRARYAEIALAVQPFAALVANISLPALLAALFLPGAGSGAVTDLGALVPAVVWGVVLGASALLIGALMGGVNPVIARGLGIVSGLRNISAVLAVLAFAGGREDGRQVAAALAAYVAILLVTTITAGEWGRKPIAAAVAAAAAEGAAAAGSAGSAGAAAAVAAPPT